MAEESFVIVKYDYTAQDEQELSIQKNERKESFIEKATESFKSGFSGKSRSKSDFNSQNSFPDHSLTSLNTKTQTAIAKYDYQPQREDELALFKGAQIRVVDKSSDGWWKGELNGKCGWFPSNYVEDEAGVETQNGGVTNGEHPAHDPEWWLARNVLKQTGLVPTNYIEVIEPNPTKSAFSVTTTAAPNTKYNGNGTTYLAENNSASTSSNFNSANLCGPYATQLWYFGRVSREESDSLLNTRGIDGDFLIRDSESNPGDYSISLKDSARNKHFWVQVDKLGASFKIGNRCFKSMDELIAHYMKFPIFIHDSGDGGNLYLKRPLPKY